MDLIEQAASTKIHTGAQVRIGFSGVTDDNFFEMMSLEQKRDFFEKLKQEIDELPPNSKSEVSTLYNKLLPTSSHIARQLAQLSPQTPRENSLESLPYDVAVARIIAVRDELTITA
jgi:hypothetical protein